MNFRYSNFWHYYVIKIGSGLFLFFSLFYSLLILLSCYPENTTVFKNIVLPIVIIAFALILSYYFSFKIATKVTNKKGTAIFNEKSVIFEFEKNISIPYHEIEQIIYTRIPRHVTAWFDLPRCRLKICTKKQKIVIHSSFLEAWENQKISEHVKSINRVRPEPLLYKVAQKTSILSNIQIETEYAVW